MRTGRVNPLPILLAFAAALFVAWVVITQPLFPVKASPSPLDFHRALTRHVYAIGILSPRNPENQTGLDDVAHYIAREWEDAHLEPQQQVFQVNGRNYKNIFVNLGPDTEDVIVVGAHYDAYGPFQGADDNASGVAGVLELAKSLAKIKLPTRVILVAYALEESPYFGTSQMGSAAHAQALRQAGKKIRAMLSLEMIGYFSDEAGSQQYPVEWLKLLYPAQGNFIAVVANFANSSLTRLVKRSMRSATPLLVHSINAPSLVPGLDLSDHRSFWAEGAPAVMITDTAPYRNQAYHTAGDIPERLDYRRMSQVVAGVQQAIVDLANE